MTEDQEEYLKKVMSQLDEGGLPKQTTKMTYKALEELRKSDAKSTKGFGNSTNSYPCAFA